MYSSYEDLILDRQERAEEDFNYEADVECNRPLDEVYPFLFHRTEK